MDNILFHVSALWLITIGFFLGWILRSIHIRWHNLCENCQNGRLHDLNPAYNCFLCKGTH